MNKYEVQEVIDEGAYGVVLKAFNKQTQRYVAMKKFKEGDEDELVRKSIQREIKMLRMLRGPYVIDLKEAFKRKGKVYLIFEYMEKNVLNLIEDYDTGLPPDIICNIMYQLMKGLTMLHSKDIVHRDIKPQNLLLNSESKLKICDFGFTRNTCQPGQPLTDYVATRWYRSPELLVGDHYSKPLDIWAAGCIMGEMIDGMPMFPGENQMDQLYLIKKTLGELTQKQLEVFYGNQRFVGLKFPEIRKVETLESKYIGKISKSAMSFLKACLRMDQFERITAAQALKHPYFISLASKDSLQDLLLLQQPSSSSSPSPPLLPSHQTVPRDSNPKLDDLDTAIHHQRTPSLVKDSNTHGLGLKTIYNTSLKLANTIELTQLRSPKGRYKPVNKVIKEEPREKEKQRDDKSRKKDQHNLPKLKEKSQKMLQTKAASQPLMILNQVPKAPVQSLPQGPSLFNLSVMGHSKSIMKLKKY